MQENGGPNSTISNLEYSNYSELLMLILLETVFLFLLW